MADASVENARALKARLAARLQELEGERSTLTRQLADVERFLKAADAYANIGDTIPTVTTSFAHTPVREGKRARNPRREDVLDVVVSILNEAGKPLQLRELYDAVTSRGIVLTGTDPVAVLGTMAWRGGNEGVLVNIKGRGYWPANLPIPD